MFQYFNILYTKDNKKLINNNKQKKMNSFAEKALKKHARACKAQKKLLMKELGIRKIKKPRSAAQRAATKKLLARNRRIRANGGVVGKSGRGRKSKRMSKRYMKGRGLFGNIAGGLAGVAADATLGRQYGDIARGVGSLVPL